MIPELSDDEVSQILWKNKVAKQAARLMHCKGLIEKVLGWIEAEKAQLTPDDRDHLAGLGSGIARKADRLVHLARGLLHASGRDQNE